MSVYIDGLPVYNANIDIEGDETGMLRVSLVDRPAVMSDFLAFKEEKPALLFNVQDDEKHLVYGVLMRADFPIYREGPQGGYYIMFEADTIRRMAEKYLAEGRQNEVNLGHVPGSDIEGADMVQMFIKDSAKGVAPVGFENIADGSLFAEYHITNEDVWQQIKDGTFKGFSIEVSATVNPATDGPKIEKIVKDLQGKFSKTNKTNRNMTKLERMKAKLAAILAEFASTTTDKGVIVYEGDELEEGLEVFVEDENGERTPALEGDYILEDGRTIVVADGKVAEIKEAEEEKVEEEAPVAEEETTIEAEAEEETEETAEVEEAIEDTTDALDELEKRVANLENTIAMLNERLAVLEGAPAADDAHEDFKKSEQKDDRMSRAARVAAAMRR